MHILVLPSWYRDPERFSSGSFFHQQAIALAEIGHRVAIVYVESRSLRYFSLGKFIRDNHFQISQKEEKGALEFCCKGWSFRPQTRFGAWIMIWQTLRLVERYIRQYGKPDVIHAHSSLWAGYIGKILSEKYSIKYVLTEHASSFVSDDFKSWVRPYISLALKHASLSLAVSGKLADCMRKFCKTKDIVVFPNFIDTFFFRNTAFTDKTKDGFVFFSLGNLIPVKGFDILCQAFANAFRDDENVKLIIGGSGYLERELKKEVYNLGVQKQIIFLGQIGREEVAKYMNYADVFVLASRMETFGVVFAEAMAAGKPVVATRCGGPESFIVDGCGLFVDQENIEQLTAALQNIRYNISRFDSEYIRQYAYENFDNRQLAYKLTDLYGTLL